MDRKLLSNDPIHFVGQNLIRIILASYFMAAALGLITGPISTPIFATFMDAHLAQVTGGVVTFVTAFLLLCGTQVRAVALLLGLQTFWSSYLMVFGPQALGTIDVFWRDLALVAALMLTYLSRDRASQARAAIVRPHRRVRPVGRGAKVTPKRVVPTGKPAERTVPTRPMPTLVQSNPAPARPKPDPARSARLNLSDAVDAEINNIFVEAERRLSA